MFYNVGITDVWQLIATAMVFLMLPGPGTFCILTCSGQRGLRGGFASLAGVMLGDAVLMFLAAAGVAALLQTNQVFFKGLQYAGAIYLAYIGVRLLWAKDGQGAVATPFSNLADFRRGFLVTLVNPKAIFFYMAFFPLFINPAAHRGSVTFFAVGAVIACCTLFYGSVLVLAGNAAATQLKQNRLIATIASRAAGVFLIGFGIKMTNN
jgi:leucine efflux protein